MLRITGGKVYDPANDIHGEVKDICIKGGRIVADDFDFRSEEHTSELQSR